MGRWRRTTACERAAQWISLELDDELGAIERDGLARHLGRCEPCRLVSRDIGAFTVLLREATVLGRESHASPKVESGGTAGRGRRAALAGSLAAVVAAAAAVAFLPHSSQRWASTPGFEDTSQQLRFAREEHARIEPSTTLAIERLSLHVPGFRALD